MSPLILDGSFMLVVRWPWWLPLRQNNIVKVSHPVYGDIVKRVISVNSDKSFELIGMNDASVSTTKMGSVNRQFLLGRVLWYSKPPVKK